MTGFPEAFKRFKKAHNIDKITDEFNEVGQVKISVALWQKRNLTRKQEKALKTELKKEDLIIEETTIYYPKANKTVNRLRNIESGHFLTKEGTERERKRKPEEKEPEREIIHYKSGDKAVYRDKFSGQFTRKPRD